MNFRIIIFVVTITQALLCNSCPTDYSLLSYNEYRQHCDRTSVLQDCYREKCCKYLTAIYRAWWDKGGNFLTTYLTTLQEWKCPQFKKECKNPTYDFNQFTKLTYNNFCNKQELHEICANQFSEINKKTFTNAVECGNGNNSSTNGSLLIQWRQLVDNLEPSELELNDALNPCISVALFDKVGFGKYFEVIQPHLPFCDMVWAGMDSNTADRLMISPWLILPLRCRRGIIFAMCVSIFLGILIICANFAVVTVFIMKPGLRNTQFYYKLSIALADFIVGAIVFPTFIVSQAWSIIYHRPLGPFYNGSLFPDENSTMDGSYSHTHVEQRKDGGGFSIIFNQSYLDFVGFFTTMSLFVSVYTLMVASFDRFIVIFRPLHYDKDAAKKRAKYVCFVLWIFSVIICTIPIYLKSLKYTLISSILVTSGGSNSLILLTFAFVLPLVIIWVLTIATFTTSLQHAKMRKKISIKSEKKTMSVELRLARTLALMIGVFSACVVPTIVVLIVPMIVDNITFTKTNHLNIESAKIFTSCEYCVVILLMTNSLWNCFIYSIRDARFRAAITEIFCRDFCRKVRFNDKKLTSKSGTSRSNGLSLNTFDSSRYDGTNKHKTRTWSEMSITEVTNA